MYAIRSYYDESGLQHELALFLKMNNKNLTVRLEYPTSRVFNSLPQLKKKKIDIYVKTETEKQYIRITSYNVCYTKLLRACNVHRRSPRRRARDDRRELQ